MPFITCVLIVRRLPSSATSSMVKTRFAYIMRLIGNRSGIAHGAIYYVLHDIDVLPGQVVIM